MYNLIFLFYIKDITLMINCVKPKHEINAERFKEPLKKTIAKSSTDSENDTQIIFDPTTENITDKQEMKRLKWNAYMRKYNERKKHEREERLNKVLIKFKNNEKLYEVNEVNDIINNFVIIGEKIYNAYVNYFDPSLTEQINLSANDLSKYCQLLQNAILSLINS